MEADNQDLAHRQQALIRAIEPALPACVLRASRDPVRRRLTLRGERFPTSNHGLQFRRLSDDALSIIFDMEVEWLSAQQVALDMALVRDLLWPDRVVRLAARLMDTADANYRPLSAWSEPFILADDADACGMPEVEPVGVRGLPPVTDRTWGDLLHRLDALDFFRYAEPGILAELLAVADTFDSFSDFCCALEEYPTLRSWSADGEDLAEGGIAAWLAQLQPLFATQGLTLTATQERSPSGEEYMVTVNGRPVAIFTAEHRPTLGTWPTAAIRAVEIVDALLIEAGSPERVYIPTVEFGGNGGRMLILTPAMAEAINASSLVSPADRLLTMRQIAAWH